ncbi:acyl carrier protein [Streptomyces sp. DB-54]
MTVTVFANQVATLLVERFGVEADEASADTSMRDLDLDSLSLVEFSLVAEKEFGVKLSDDEVKLDDTIADVAELIDVKLSGKAALD